MVEVLTKGNVVETFYEWLEKLEFDLLELPKPDIAIFLHMPTDKVQELLKNRSFLDENENEALNTWVPFDERAIPFDKMVYIADGITDVPCMRLVKNYGGKAIAVYNPKIDQSKQIAKKLIEEGRANFMSEANYEKDGQMEQIAKVILDHMSADDKLAKIAQTQN